MGGQDVTSPTCDQKPHNVVSYKHFCKCKVIIDSLCSIQIDRIINLIAPKFTSYELQNTVSALFSGAQFHYTDVII